jgi:tetratricopeptide (TPR) repeat protein
MIGDFGLAVAVDRSRLTQAGMMVGTVSYMAPEQAMGGEVTPRADLYALGAMLYEMVCGRPPFVGDESVAIIGQHLNTPPVAPTWHRPDCPPALETLILRLLEKDPEKRPASAAEVRDALRAAGTSARAATQTMSRTEPAPGADPLYRTVFVGREAELKQLQQSFDAAMSGQGGLVMVVGEPGIGKTALCEQLATYVSIRGGRTLVGHCYEEGSLSLPYLAFVEAMRTYVLARDPDGLKSDLGSGAADVARIVSEVRDRVSVELRDASDPEDDRWRLLQSVTTFLRNASSVQPLVIVLEDLHWADRGTLDLLQHVARNLQGARLVIVGTYRDVEVDRTHPLSGVVAELRRSGTFLRVPLRGLTVDEVHRMYEQIRGQTVAWAQAEIVHRATEGNPLFVQEVLRYLVEEGIVQREGGRYVAQGPGVGIPEGLRDVVGRRLNRLGERANQILSIAAVIGRDFRLDVLQRVCQAASAASAEEVVNALEEAQERAIIEHREMLGTVGFRFTHAFFRQTLYDEIFTPRRIRLHQFVGRSLEEVHSRRLEEHAAELVEHFVQSTEPDDLGKAVHYGELAAQRAVLVFAYGEAVRHLEQALRAQEVLGPSDPSKTCDLLLALIEPLSLAGDSLRAFSEVAEEAFQVADSGGDSRRALLAMRLADEAMSRFDPAGHADRVKWAARGDRLAQPGTVDRVYADFILSRVGASLFSDDAIELRRHALALAESLGDVPAMFRVGIFTLIDAWRVPRNWPSALLLVKQAENWPREGIGSTRLGHVLAQCGFAYYTHGEIDEARRFFSDLRSLSERTRDFSLILMSTAIASHMEFHDGNLDGAIKSAQEVALREEQSGMRMPGGGFVAISRGAVYLGDNDLISSIAHQEYRGTNPERGGASVLGPALALASRGASAESRARLLSFAQSRDPDDVPCDLLTLALEAALMIEDRETAAEFSRPLESMMSGLAPASVARLLGRKAELFADVPAARSCYETAIDVCSRAHCRPDLALSHLNLAELLLEHYPGERDAAIEHLDFAISELREMKMQPALERALRHRGLLKA